MVFRYIFSFIFLITLVNFHGDIFAARTSRTPASSPQVQMQRCAMCKQQKPAHECTATKFSVYCRACLLASGIDVPPVAPVDAPTTTTLEPQQLHHFNRPAVVVCAAIVTAATYSIIKKIRNKFKTQAQNNQTQDSKVKQNEL